MANYCFVGTEFKGFDQKPTKGGKLCSYPSVSAILGLLDKSGALIPWAQRITCEYIVEHWEECKGLEGHALSIFFERARKESTKKKEVAGAYGSSLHKILEMAIKDEPVLSEAQDDVEFYMAIQGLIKRSQNWESEFPVVNVDAGYAGCVDLYDAGNHVVYDLKTGKGIYPEHYKQVGAYWDALESMGYPVSKAVILHWDKEELVLNEVECTAKVQKKRASFSLLVDFYYADKKRRVWNARTMEAA